MSKKGITRASCDTPSRTTMWRCVCWPGSSRRRWTKTCSEGCWRHHPMKERRCRGGWTIWPLGR
eukprot:9049505-Prorocentrum_lima.AAC.1